MRHRSDGRRSTDDARTRHRALIRALSASNRALRLRERDGDALDDDGFTNIRANASRCARSNVSRTARASSERGGAEADSTASARLARVARDLHEHTERGRRRKLVSETKAKASVLANGNTFERVSGFGETPRYLLERKATLLREMNAKMERTIQDIDERRMRKKSDIERDEAKERKKIQMERARRARARAEKDAEKITPRQRMEARREIERARELFARARIFVDQGV